MSDGAGVTHDAATTSDAEVTAEPPDGAFRTTGTDHVTLIGSNPEETVAFYRDVLGMRLVLRQPNLDRPDVTHLFFDSGDGRLVTFFVHEDRESVAEQDPDVGAVHHLAFRVDHDRLDAVRDRLAETDHGYSEFDRGAFHALYTRDHNGLTVELVVDKFAIPDDRRADVLALAHSKRVAEGAEYVAGDHVVAALEELGIEVERRDLPDAPAGRGVPGGD
jgi:catechol 2,3-dioxygenase-like lactoylglutathione lyase family enzyme